MPETGKTAGAGELSAAMKHPRPFFALLFLFLTPPLCAAPPASQNPPAIRVLMAHYMPWFAAKPTGKEWGWHWTMGHFAPDKTTNGRQEAASQFRPLIGLYDSGDPDALECHVLLMKLAGIDGVMVDWYGTDDFNDYAVIQRNTQSLITWIKRAGLKFAICFEDQTVPKLIAAGKITDAEAVAHGQATLQWMQTHWFSDPAYLKQNGRPVFLVFGAGYYQGEQWTKIFAPLPTPPQFYTESEPRPPAVGAFDWPKPEDANAQNLFYAHAQNWPDFIPVAFPRFQDFYAEAGVQKSYGRIDDRNGKTYTDTLERALQSRAPIVQLVTWNDWGEGTQIEPSVEFGYRDLEATQRLRRRYLTPKLPHTAADLRLPVTLYKLRKTFTGQPAVQSKLDAVSRLLLAGRPSQARALLAKYRLGLPKPSEKAFSSP